MSLSKYETTCLNRAAMHGNQFSTVSLNPEFIDAYNKGERFRVLVRLYADAKPQWGYVGMTTGWVPTFLLMRRRGQYGSSDVIGMDVAILNSKWIK